MSTKPHTGTEEYRKGMKRAYPQLFEGREMERESFSETMR